MNIKQYCSNLPFSQNSALLMVLTLGLLFGALISYIARPSNKNFRIEYISQMEILELENERVKDTNATDLFFGKAEEAITLMEDLVRLRESKGARVVFSTEGIISGTNVVSISEEIYSKVITSLEKQEPKVLEDEGSTRSSQKVNRLGKRGPSKRVSQIMNSLQPLEELEGLEEEHQMEMDK